jgi:Family of unknown function (DUF6448)
MKAVVLSVRALVVLVAFSVVAAIPAAAHCDTLDGPVVAAAKRALSAGDVTPVLKWVRAEHEAEIRDAFARTLKVRGQSSEARELADRYFFETLVRIHRAGESAPYSGLKPAGEVEPGIAAADSAMESGKVEPLAAAVSKEIADGIRQRFARVQQARPHAEESVEAGREYVEAYVTFIHYVEGLHQAIAATSGHGESKVAHIHPE